MNAQADSRLQRMRDEQGRYLAKLSDEDWMLILLEVAAGRVLSDICDAYEVSRWAISAKRRSDPDFAEAYQQALVDGWVATAEDIQTVTRGKGEYAKYDVHERRLIAKYDLALAEKFAAEVLGPKTAPTVAVQINYNRLDDDMC